MAGVVFVFVREDAIEAETLADAFDAAGYSITGNSADENALSVIVWSRAALCSPAFKQAAERALCSGKALVASLIAPPPRESVFDAPVIDLADWDGEDSAALDLLFETADEILCPTGANVIGLPFRPAFEDAEFTEVSAHSVEDECAKRARRAWEAPIPTEMFRPSRPVRDPPPPKHGAPVPRRDFRRVGQRKPVSYVHAALAFAVIALVGGGGFAPSIAPDPAPPAARVELRAELSEPSMPVSLTSASAGAADLEDVTPVEPLPLFEPQPQRGHAGVEPPSARSIHRVAHTPRSAGRGNRPAFEPPALIPDSVVEDLERADPRAAEQARG